MNSAEQVARGTVTIHAWTEPDGLMYLEAKDATGTTLVAATFSVATMCLEAALHLANQYPDHVLKLGPK